MNRGVHIVTGGSSGIGEAICRRLLEQGAEVVSIDLRQLRFEHERLHYFEADLSDSAETLRVAREVASTYKVAALVNNAGVVRPAALENVALEDLDYLVGLHLRASLVLAQAVIPGMRAAGFGRIVNIGSRATLGKEGRSLYAATKLGLSAFARTWALELGPCGITVNTVSPGPIATDLFLNNNTPQVKQKILDSTAVKRFGTSEDVARAVLFFLAPESGFITGQTLYVCGGSSIASAAI